MPPHKKKAKVDKSAAIKETTKPKPRTTVVTDSDDVSAIFSALSKKKSTAESSKASASSSFSASAAASSASAAPLPAHLAQRAAVSSADRAARPRRDGLYHAPEKDMHMNDLGFFGGAVRGGRMVHAPAATSATDGDEKDDDDDALPEVSEALLNQEGVNRIVSMNQLRKMLSRNPNAGSTPNCPFDCDCCF